MTIDQIVLVLKSFLPRRWFKFGGQALGRLLKVIAAGLSFAIDTARTIAAETLTKSAVDSLDEKERELGLSGDGFTIDERRRRIQAWQWQRGGPTNKHQFEEGLKLLSGYEIKLVPDYENYSITFEIYDAPGTLNLDLLEDFVIRNKLGHLAHSFVFITLDELTNYHAGVLQVGEFMTVRQVV